MSSRFDAEGLAPIHRIIHIFSKAVAALGHPASPSEVERWSVLVDEAMAGRSRFFHGHEHLFELTRTDDAIEALAGLFHDVVYVQVDQGLPSRIAPVVGRYLESTQGAYAMKTPAEGDTEGWLVYELFDVKPGAKLTVSEGLNEVASALVAVRELCCRLPMPVLAEVACCIEATIPFRPRDAQGATPFERLATRLRRANERFGLGLDETGLTAAMHRAVHVAHRDVQSFSEEDAALFLDKTWKLLPESNPALRMPDAYGIREYRVALQKMEGFFQILSAERVFYAYRGEPPDASHQEVLARATSNLDLGARYLRAKLYAIALLEALAAETGGDAPIELFAGGIPGATGSGVMRLENHLPQVIREALDQEPVVSELLSEGRASETSFDIRGSPTAAFLYRLLGESVIEAGVKQARQFFQGALSGRAFLDTQPRVATVAVARAVARVAVTRTEELDALATAFESSEAS